MVVRLNCANNLQCHLGHFYFTTLVLLRFTRLCYFFSKWGIWEKDTWASYYWKLVLMVELKKILSFTFKTPAILVLAVGCFWELNMEWDFVYTTKVYARNKFTKKYCFIFQTNFPKWQNFKNITKKFWITKIFKLK